jgi:Na+/H+ antiporter NhaD/arsenite permease-like protein
MTSMWVVGGIFFLVYALIVSERVHRTVSALLGGLVMIFLGVLDQNHAFAAVDWNVIFLLIGMMAIANVLRDTGLFQWIAFKAVKLGRGHPFRILVLLSLITAVSSAFLNNVTIVVLVVPITLFVASSLRVSPLPFLISEILATNVGGTATLIGDPPNVLIASAANIDFATFAVHLAPISLIILVAFIPLSWVIFRRDLEPEAGHPVDFEALEASALITDRPLLAKCVIVIALVLAGFLLHGILALQPATVAMSGATLLLLWARSDLDRVFRDMEWTTLFFFVGLFIMVEAVVRVGLIESAAQVLLRLTGNNGPVTTMVVLWLSALVSGVVDNIPYTATMIPLIRDLGRTMPAGPLWWALALGADLGGNATLVGASSNIIVASLAARSGHPISFRRFLAYGLATTLLSLVLSTVYVWLRYLR